MPQSALRPVPDLPGHRSADDEIEQAFPGSVLTHVLEVVTRDRLAVAIAALELIGEAGGRLEALHLARRGDSHDHRLKVVGLRPRQARALCDRLRSEEQRLNSSHRIASRMPSSA